MDKGKIYIKMSKHPLIQGQWPKKFKITDYCFNKKTKEIGIYHFAKRPWKSNPLKDFIWLPRQDQIQEICKKRHLYYLLKDIQIFQVKHTIKCKIESMEQLWLDFYMYEKHKLLWDDEKWTKEEK